MSTMMMEEGILRALMSGPGLMHLAVIAGGSAIGGSLASGEPVKEVLMAMEGSVGVVAGYVVGMLALPAFAPSSTSGTPQAPPAFVPYLPWIGAAVVPLIAGGTVDRALIGLLVGAKIGTLLA